MSQNRLSGALAKVLNYRLCGCAAGSAIGVIFSFVTLIMVSCLHFGQNSGKFSNFVSSLILSRVLLPQAGHSIHSVSFIFSPDSILISSLHCNILSQLLSDSATQASFLNDLYISNASAPTATPHRIGSKNSLLSGSVTDSPATTYGTMIPLRPNSEKSR